MMRYITISYIYYVVTNQPEMKENNDFWANGYLFKRKMRFPNGGAQI